MSALMDPPGEHVAGSFSGKESEHSQAGSDDGKEEKDLDMGIYDIEFIADT
jgi:hypothetical protein